MVAALVQMRELQRVDAEAGWDDWWRTSTGTNFLAFREKLSQANNSKKTKKQQQQQQTTNNKTHTSEVSGKGTKAGRRFAPTYRTFVERCRAPARSGSRGPAMSLAGEAPTQTYRQA
jgi:hypothetical protein